MDIENVTESRKILIQSSGNHWSDQYRSSYGNFMLGNQSSFDRRYGTGAYKLAIEVYLNPVARNQWMSGSVSLDKGFWMESTRSYGDSEWHGFSSSRNQLTGVEVINKFVRFNGTSGRVEGGDGNEQRSILPSITSYISIGGGIIGGLEQSYKYGDNTVKYAQIVNGKVRAASVLTRASQMNAAKMATGLKVVGRSVTGLSVATAGYQFANSNMSGNDYARLTGSLVITGTAFIPLVGPIISIGLGVADNYGAFDDIYNYFE